MNYKILAIVGIAVFFIALLIPSRNYVSRIISDMVKQENKRIMEVYENRLEASEKEVASLRKSLKSSDKKIEQLNKKIGALEHDITSNALPENYKEILDRFVSLGFNPVSCTCN